MRYDTIITTEAGLITGPLNHHPCSWFLPNGLHQTTCQSNNLTTLGTNIDAVNGSSIALSLNASVGATLGEFCERYCLAYEDGNRLVLGSYQELAAEPGRSLVHPADFKLYAAWQYAQPDFPFVPFTVHDRIAWVNGTDLLTNREILVPAFLVFLPHDTYYDQRKSFIQNTSTGAAAGQSLARATQGGFLECAERHAFCTWWYKQAQPGQPPVPTYDAPAVLRSYPNNAVLRQLYHNERVRFKVFDLSAYGPVDTMVAFMFYTYKGRQMYALGMASRFDPEEALIKAALECYQGVDYGIQLEHQYQDWTSNPADFSNINDFHLHFALYNRFPALCQQVPLLKEAFDPAVNAVVVAPSQGPKMRSLADLPLAGLPHVVRVEVTTPDVREVGIAVTRVLTPGWAYLTGSHATPFLGAEVFRGEAPLFTAYPHPFP